MKPLGFASQILAVGLALAIALLFVRPTMTEIGTLQSDIQTYKTERQRVTEINQVLAGKVAQLESIAPSDRDRITTYMPTTLDEVQVLRDLEIIAVSTAVSYSEIQYAGLYEVDNADDDDESRAGDPVPVYHGFTMSVEGTYESIKNFLSLLEQNHYPLQTYAASLTAVENGLMGLTLSIVTYVDDQSESDDQYLYE